MAMLSIKLASPTTELQLLDIYKNLPENRMFPLIGSRLLNQKSVYCLSLSGTEVYLVISSLGFCQLIHHTEQYKSDQIFNQVLSCSNRICNELKIKKLRFYPTANIGDEAYIDKHINISLSSRNRYAYPKNKVSSTSKTIESQDLQYYIADKIRLIKDLIPFEFIDRFWGDWEKFLMLASPVVVTSQGKFASICYSAAVFNGFSEIDIYTANDYRNKGLAKEVATRYIQNLSQRSVTALWDCFSNNLGSVSLAESLGFELLEKDYQFYTVSKA